MAAEEYMHRHSHNPPVLISRVSTAGPKAGMLVCARASHVSIVTSGASLGPKARVFWPSEYLVPKRANSGLRSGYEQRQSLTKSGDGSAADDFKYQITSALKSQSFKIILVELTFRQYTYVCDQMWILITV